MRVDTTLTLIVAALIGATTLVVLVPQVIRYFRDDADDDRDDSEPRDD